VEGKGKKKKGGEKKEKHQPRYQGPSHSILEAFLLIPITTRSQPPARTDNARRGGGGKGRKKKKREEGRKVKRRKGHDSNHAQLFHLCSLARGGQP